MTVFVGVAAAMVAVSLVFVLWPLWRAGRPTPGRRREANVTIYQQRRAEIEREVAAGRLDRRAADAEQDELGARLLADIDAAPAAAEQTPMGRKPWLATAVVVLLVTVGAGGAYGLLGDYGAVTQSRMPDVATMIGDLEKQVAAHPHDLRSRAMLARAQQIRGQYAAAAENYRAVNAALDKPRAALIAAEAEARLQATRDVGGRVAELYRQLLALEPGSAEALWYLGRAAAERGDTRRAMDYWQRLLAKKGLPDDFRDRVEARRNELGGNKPKLEGRG